MSITLFLLPVFLLGFQVETDTDDHADHDSEHSSSWHSYLQAETEPTKEWKEKSSNSEQWIFSITNGPLFPSSFTLVPSGAFFSPGRKLWSQPKRPVKMNKIQNSINKVTVIVTRNKVEKYSSGRALSSDWSVNRFTCITVIYENFFFQIQS